MGYIGNVIGAGLMVGLGVVPSLVISLSSFVSNVLIFVLYRGYFYNKGIDPLFMDLVSSQIDSYKTKRLQA